jgi:hypothetical protein
VDSRSGCLISADSKTRWHDAGLTRFHHISQGRYQAEPVRAETQLPHRHSEWTRFDGGPTPVAGNQNRPTRGRGLPHGIRARKNTKLTIVDDELRLEFSGDDPGIAMDLRGRDIPAGPYRLTFRLQSGTKGDGELFYTTDPRTTLPKGERVEFDVDADGKWHDTKLRLPVEKRIYQLSLDVGAGASQATISGLKLIDSNGKQIISWPQSGNEKQKLADNSVRSRQVQDALGAD